MKLSLGACPLQTRNRDVLFLTHDQRYFIIIIITLTELLARALEHVHGGQ